ncbi:hypothetical protein [Streptomyces californicus]|uniref:hypothetical protein n=1 Tax=Streptomyces californicus TaxID=67351 RepID=UPI003411268F
MLDYQAREPELSAVRTDPASSATGLRLITVGDSPAIAEGTYRFTLGGQPTYLRNRVTTMNGALHVLLTFGPESRSEEIDTLYLQAAGSYQLSPPQRQPTPLTGRNDAAGPTRGTPHASTQSEDRRGRATPARLRTDPPRTPHHPLALTGARRGSPPAPPSAPPRPDVAPTQPQETALMATTIALDTTYAELEPGAQHVYRTLGSLPAPVADPDLVAAVCDLSLPTSGWLLEILAEERLLDPAPDGSLAARYRMNTILREHARSKAAAEPDAADQREAALRRLCDWTLKQLRHAQRLLTPAQSSLLNPRTLPDADSESPFPDEDLALAWLDDQAENLLPVLGACGDAGWDELTYQLVDAWWPFFQRRHLYELWLPAHELGVAAARRAGNEPVARQLIASWAIGISHPAAAARLRDRAASQ